ncbi:MAG: GNAT family N-acetyltransferase [Rhodothermales bacterium]
MLTQDRTIFREARTPDDRQIARAIREHVFVEEQAIPAALVHDGLDAASLHVLALYDGVPAATGRLSVSTDGEGVIARIAVLPPYRGKGLGQGVVRCLESLARREGIHRVSLLPHDYLETFYENMGYVTMPGSTVVGTHRLITMTKTLADPE